MIWLKITPFLILPLLISNCAGSGAGKFGAKGMAVEPLREFHAEELNAGYEIHAQILSSFYTYTEPKAVAYINRVGRSLIPDGPPESKHYHFTLLYSDQVYATSAPGGFIYLTTGLINFLENEAELAAVIAHEIGTLQYLDPRLSTAQRTLDRVTQTATVIGPAFGQIGALATVGVVLVHAAATNNGLSKEEQLIRADERALRYMLRAGYDPQGLIDFLYRFLNADSDTMPYLYDYLQSRSVTYERFGRVQQVFQELPLRGKTLPVHRERFMDNTKGIREIYRVS